MLTTRPLETETKLAYAGVGDLLDGVQDRLGVLPAPQAHALRAALLLESPDAGVVDERAVALGFLGLLVAEAPVLLAVDDLQWLDRQSARVLAFAAHRVGETPVAFLVALRAEERAGLSFVPERVLPNCTNVPVRGLDLESIYRLIRDRLGVVLPRPSLLSVYETAAGNPFFALELTRAAQQPGKTRPVSPTLRELVGSRITALPPETRAALCVAAALADPTLDLVGAASEGDATAALGPAVAAEIVSLESGRIRFAHPLLAAAAYDAAASHERRDVHSSLAAVVPDREEQVRHLALAAEGPDPDVASALDEAARLARARGAPVAAAELYEEARALTPRADRSGARRRAVDAARCQFESGDSRRARSLLETTIAELPAGAERARALLVLAPLRSYDDDMRAAVALYEQALAEADAGQPRARQRARGHLGQSLPPARALRRGGRRTPEQQLRSARSSVTDSSSPRRAARSSSPRPHSGTRRQERPRGGRRRWRRRRRRASSRARGSRSRSRGCGGRSSTRRTTRSSRRSSGPPRSVTRARCRTSRCSSLRPIACAVATRRQPRTPTSPPIVPSRPARGRVFAYALALRGLAAAYRGQVDEARAATGRALELARSTSGRPAEQFATAALGLLELSLERSEQAVDVLAPLVVFARDHGMAEPGLTRFVPDLVEGLVACGRLAEAEDHLSWYEANAERLERASAQGASARCRGLLAAAAGELGAALAAFERAHAHHERAPMPFDRARTLLALGSARRRANERRAARDTLVAARELFASLGAAVWEQRADAELARIGGRAPATGELTPIEARVAELTAAGQTNREVAASLFLSIRTVEGHLSRIYGKLGVRSRVELARRLDRSDP